MSTKTCPTVLLRKVVMKLKLLSAAATSTLAALLYMPGQTANADECILDTGSGTGRSGARSAGNEFSVACGHDAGAATNSVALGKEAFAGWSNGSADQQM